MSNEINSIDELANFAAETEDQSITTAGGDFERELPVAGVTVGRFIEYIEIGMQPQRPYEGKPKPDEDEVFLLFELTHPKNVKEIEVNGEKIKIADQIRIRVSKKTGEKAKFKKIFNKMTYGRPIKHMAQMLGEAFVLTVVHNKAKTGDKVYANINTKEQEWLIGAPVKSDPLEGTTVKLNVPEALHARRIFLWDRPTKATWDSLFIDGTRTVKDAAGAETEVSKNWLQTLILSAKNYGGSPLEAMLAGVADLPTTEAEVKTTANPTVQSQTQDTNTSSVSNTTSTTASPSEQAAAALAASKPAATTVQDDLAALGL